jgi:hypothetical protein
MPLAACGATEGTAASLSRSAALRQGATDVQPGQGTVGQKPGTQDRVERRGKKGRWVLRRAEQRATAKSVQLFICDASGHGKIQLGHEFDWPPPRCRVDAAYFWADRRLSLAMADGPCMLSLNAPRYPRCALPRAGSWPAGMGNGNSAGQGIVGNAIELFLGD